jgi:hypothetical protein
MIHFFAATSLSTKRTQYNYDFATAAVIYRSRREYHIIVGGRFSYNLSDAPRVLYAVSLSVCLYFYWRVVQDRVFLLSLNGARNFVSGV